MIFLSVTFIVSVFAVIIIPKHLSYLEMYTTSFFATFLAALADLYLDVKFDWYGFFNKGVDYEYIPIFMFIYPAANILFLNFFPYRKSRLRKLFYVLIVSLLTLLFEYISLHTEVFYHHEWNLWYSAISYPILYYTLYLNLLLIRRLNKHK